MGRLGNNSVILRCYNIIDSKLSEFTILEEVNKFVLFMMYDVAFDVLFSSIYIFWVFVIAHPLS